jgi:hypothetical protein
MKKAIFSISNAHSKKTLGRIVEIRFEQLFDLSPLQPLKKILQLKSQYRRRLNLRNAQRMLGKLSFARAGCGSTHISSPQTICVFIISTQKRTL